MDGVTSPLLWTVATGRTLKLPPQHQSRKQHRKYATAANDGFIVIKKSITSKEMPLVAWLHFTLLCKQKSSSMFASTQQTISATLIQNPAKPVQNFQSNYCTYPRY
jgi:hypothetical protein